MPYMEQIDFSSLIKLTLPVIGAVDWLLSDFPDWFWWLWLPGPDVLAETSFENRLVKGCTENTCLYFQRKENTSISNSQKSFLCRKSSSVVIYVVFLVFHKAKRLMTPESRVCILSPVCDISNKLQESLQFWSNVNNHVASYDSSNFRIFLH